MEKGKNRMKVEEDDDRNVKKLKREDNMFINSQNFLGDDVEDIFYGEDSHSYGHELDEDEDEDDEVNDDGISGTEIGCCCEAGDPTPYIPQASIVTPSGEKASYWVDWSGLRTPMLIVEVEGIGETSYPIDHDVPLPHELYDVRIRHRVLPDPTKEEYDEDVRGLAKGEIYWAYRELPQHIQAEIATIALTFFKELQDGDYKYVRCVKTRASFTPQFGIHMIFIAHRQDDVSSGFLFSVHLATTDPPRVLHCHILCDLDAESVFKGKPRHNNMKVPLKGKDIACRFCAHDHNKKQTSVMI